MNTQIDPHTINRIADELLAESHDLYAWEREAAKGLGVDEINEPSETAQKLLDLSLDMFGTLGADTGSRDFLSELWLDQIGGRPNGAYLFRGILFGDIKTIDGSMEDIVKDLYLRDFGA